VLLWLLPALAAASPVSGSISALQLNEEGFVCSAALDCTWDRVPTSQVRPGRSMPQQVQRVKRMCPVKPAQVRRTVQAATIRPQAAGRLCSRGASPAGFRLRVAGRGARRRVPVLRSRRRHHWTLGLLRGLVPYANVRRLCMLAAVTRGGRAAGTSSTSSCRQARRRARGGRGRSPGRTMS
jgi:hypothetical protein